MIKVRFIKDGNEKKNPIRWRYKKDEEILLPDNMAKEAIAEGFAIDLTLSRKIENAVNPRAYQALEESKKRSLK